MISDLSAVSHIYKLIECSCIFVNIFTFVNATIYQYTHLLIQECSKKNSIPRIAAYSLDKQLSKRVGFLGGGGTLDIFG